ncbi:MAG: helix-hairpin-helix domain-containing protein [Bacteroidota bacterium]
MLKKFFHQFFFFTRREKNGVIILSVLIILLLAFRLCMPLFYSSHKTDFSEFDKEVIQFNESLKNEKSDSAQFEEGRKTFSNYPRQSDFPKPDTGKLFYFNPNNLPPEKWKQLGFADWQIRIIKKFESKGGRFRKKEDVKKIYGIRENQYSKLEPYILIPEEKPFSSFEKPTTNYPQKITTAEKIEINVADTMQLQKIPGIGEGYARIIYKHRVKLGGFQNIAQLMEVWGMDTARFNKIKPYITVNPAYIQKININTCDYKTLGFHPYLNLSIGKAIIGYRKEHGKFNELKDLKKVTLIYDDLYNKIVPYLSL